jgi:hypothetical protein
MLKRITAIALTGLSLLTLSACGYRPNFDPSDPAQRAIGGAIIGAGSGAALGGVIGGWNGVVAGATLGGIMGAIAAETTTSTALPAPSYSPPSGSYYPLARP